MNQSLPSTPAAPAPFRAFLVEDSQAVRELIMASLADIPGLVFSGFSDTESDALLRLRSELLDVVILDIELRQGNGISLLRSLAAADILPGCPKIIFSNNVSAAYRRVGEQYGVQYFFDKTTELPRLHALLAQLSAGAEPARTAGSLGLPGAI